jgi:DNA-directed RNA polymerase subunit N (RpoN/RPB10)
MIIPVKCYTCGQVLADKYNYWKREVRKMKVDMGLSDDIVYFSGSNVEKTPEAIVLDKLKLNKLCCRRHMLTHVDI